MVEHSTHNRMNEGSNTVICTRIEKRSKRTDQHAFEMANNQHISFQCLLPVGIW
jgi:hypothetical protein